MAIAFLALPIVALVLVMRTRWFARRKRVYWAGEKPLWYRDAMDRLGWPWNAWPLGPRDRARGRRARR